MVDGDRPDPWIGLGRQEIVQHRRDALIDPSRMPRSIAMRASAA
jgi:hypothetical protein